MAARRLTPTFDHVHSDHVHKRVCKACDRCRLKKSKCDGTSPCSRCRANNFVCIFGKRKRAIDKMYPKGYIEMLEQQQRWLVNALQELYQRIIDGNGWPGTCLKPEPNGHPLTHDILVRLGTLDHSQVKYCEENLKPVQRKKSSESISEITHSPISVPCIFPETFSSPKQFCLPLIPSTYSPPSCTALIKAEPTSSLPPNPHSSSALSMQGVVRPLTLQGGLQQFQGINVYNLFDSTNTITTASYPNFNIDTTLLSPMFNRPLPINSVPFGYCDYFDQLFDPNPAEISLM
ncbi:uncharacterized protein N7487_004991 [Penicillium crustosum]|nr:uncharacterized protein N7487_004991 [Penicillium crustosum]KAJ5410632.1 hypothetical protein N7487_004991 [Penicillium crustosum]